VEVVMGLPVRWIEVEQLERVRAELVALPERRLTRVPCKRAIEMLSEEIRALSAKGYNRKEIAEELTKNGVPVSETVLRSYLRGGGEKKGRARGGAVGRRERRPVGEADGSSREAGSKAAGAVPVDSSSLPAEPAPPPRAVDVGRVEGTATERKSKFVVRNDTEEI
jgi:hypothetical protein